MLAVLLLMIHSRVASAGMPAPLPTDVDRYLVWRVNDSIIGRVQAISFFVVTLLVCTAVVRWLWNYLQKDFPRLPRLSYGKALAGVLLWGLLFIVVLTMISGARELMTPGAWEKQGFTYKLTPQSTSAEPSPVEVRRQHLEQLRTALWRFAATHNGHFPSEGEKALIPAELWTAPDAGGLHYLYVPGQSASETPALLVYEPELDPEQRFVLQTDGDIVTMRSAQIESLRQMEKRP
jgi:hypothetical protein